MGCIAQRMLAASIESHVAFADDPDGLSPSDLLVMRYGVV